MSATYRENLDLLGKKMGPVDPKKEYGLLDAVKKTSPLDTGTKVRKMTGMKTTSSGASRQLPLTGKPLSAAQGTGWSAPTYSSRHQKTFDDAVAALRAVKPFSYDPESDPLFQGYKKTYTREGQRAMQDTLGEVSARTGGLASSYATSAAQQANNGYMQQLADKIPQLLEMAYRMYRDRLGDLRADVDLYGGLEDRDRSRFESDRNFGYGVHRDQVADERYADELAYDRGRDALADRRYEDELAYNRDRDKLADQRYDDERAYERRQDDIGHGWDVYNATGRANALGKAMGMDEETMQALIDTYARKKDLEEGQAAREIADWYVSHGDLSKLQEMGLDTGYDKALLDAERRAAALKGTGSSGGGGGSSQRSSKNSEQPTGTSLAKEAIVWAAQTGGDPEDYIKANYKDRGYTSKDAAVSELNVYLTENPEWDPSKLSGQMLGKFQAGLDAIKSGGYVSESEQSHGPVYTSLMDRAKYLTKGDPQWVALGDKIDQAYDDGDITQAEYDALFKAMGH